MTGLLGGLFGGLLGLGGGFVMVPLMTKLLRMSQHRAHGTSLFAVLFIGFSGALTYFRYGAVDWKVSIMLAVTAALTARLGAIYAHSLSERELKRAFGIFLLIVGPLIVARGYVPWGTQAVAGPMVLLFVFLAAGAGAGFLAGMMGVGGALIMIPPMVLLGGMAQQVAQGTSFLAMVPMALAGSLTNRRLGNIDLGMGPGLIVGAVAGGYIGGSVANLLPESYLKIIFAGVVVWLGLRYLR